MLVILSKLTELDTIFQMQSVLLRYEENIMLHIYDSAWCNGKKTGVSE